VTASPGRGDFRWRSILSEPQLGRHRFTWGGRDRGREDAAILWYAMREPSENAKTLEIEDSRSEAPSLAREIWRAKAAERGAFIPEIEPEQG
jgi:hypothetical protein